MGIFCGWNFIFFVKAIYGQQQTNFKLASGCAAGCLLVTTFLVANTGLAANVEPSASNLSNSDVSFLNVRVPLNSISVSINKYNLRDPDRKETTWVSMSPKGMRSRSADGEAEVVKNFGEHRVWMLNLKRKIKHEVDVQAFEQQFPDLTKFLLGVETQSNVLGSEPCSDFNAEYVGERDWRGQTVGEWLCKNDDGTSNNVQFYSDRWQFVVRVEFPDQNVEEAVNIREKEFDAVLFHASSELESVDLDYFLDGVKKLEKFEK